MKRLGQNFLTDPSILARIAIALEPDADDCVVEIGAGRGALTEELARRARRVIAIEVDRMLIPLLRDRFAGRSNVEILEGDALELPLHEVAGEPWKVVGNIPYNITTPLLFHAAQAPHPRLLVFLVQREVAERAAAPPDSEEYGALSVNLQATMRVELVMTVPPGAFTPRPSVESAVLRLRPLGTPVVHAGEEAAFRTLVIAAFGMRRKQMRRILRGTLGVSADEATQILLRAGVDPMARPETLSPGEFADLLRAIRS